MNIAITGGTGFIGTNLSIRLSENESNNIRVIDSKEDFYLPIKKQNKNNISFYKSVFSTDTDFDSQVKNQDIVFHLASTNIPGTSNNRIPEELMSNVVVTACLLDACIRQHVKKVVFISSGGTVYGNPDNYPIVEDTVTCPISSYGIQKLTIEKMLYMYRYQYGLDYRIIRLANPYGPYQRPNGVLGVVTTFIYRALTDGKLLVYGDGTVIRDFIFISDAIDGILKVSNGENEQRVFNLGSGKGTSVNEVISAIRETINHDLTVQYIEGRPVDVPINYLDIRRYENLYGRLNRVDLYEGIMRTAEFLKKEYKID